MATVTEVERIATLMGELDNIAFLHEPDFGRDASWRPVSDQGKRIWSELIAPKNRNALKQWYQDLRDVELNPSAEHLRKALESAAGEKLG